MSELAPVLSAVIDRIKTTRYENPVVTKEIRTRMRGAKAHWLMMFYVLLLGVVVLITYYGLWMSGSSRGYDPRAWLSLRVGFQLFAGLTITQSILIALIAPALTSGSMTIEKEQQTMEMLSLTSLSPRNMVAGKLASAMLFILMLLGCSLPLAGICLMFGSISPLEIAVTYLMLIGWAFLLCSMGVVLSSVCRRTSAASLVAFGTTVVYSLVAVYVVFEWVAQYMFRGGYGRSFGGGFLFNGLAPFISSYLCLETAPVFGVKVPLALVALAFDISVGLFLLTIATTKMPFHRVDKSRAVRLWILGISLVSLFLLFGNLFGIPGGFGTASRSDSLVTMLVLLLIAIMPCIPAFSTGAVGKGKRVVSEILLGPVRTKFFSRSPAGGLWFLVLWFVAGCAAIAASLAIASTMTGSYRHVPGGVLLFTDWPMFIQTAAALLASVIGVSSVGVLCSTVCSTRQSAAAVVVLFLILTWVAYPMMMMQHESAIGYGWQKTHGPQWQLAYLWPGTPLTVLSGDWRQGQNAPQLWLPGGVVLLGCTLAWCLLSAGVLALASKVSGRGGIPDE